jgi:hypothetical protein
MKLLKKLGLAFSAIAFLMSLAVMTTYAQPGKARYEGNRGKHRGWTIGKHRGWNRDRNWERRDERWERRNDRLDRRNDRAYSRGRITAEELQRLERRRERLDSLADRYEDNGRINNREQRRLNRRYSTYNRRYRRAVRNQ